MGNCVSTGAPDGGNRIHIRTGFSGYPFLIIVKALPGSEFIPARAIAAMRDRLATAGSGNMAVPAMVTDLYIHGRRRFVVD